jgi:hypothetical protein
VGGGEPDGVEEGEEEGTEGLRVSKMYGGGGKAEGEEDSTGFLSSMGSMAPKAPLRTRLSMKGIRTRKMTRAREEREGRRVVGHKSPWTAVSW